MKWKTRFVCLLVAATLLLCCTPAAAASGGGQNNEDREGFLAWADSLRLADPGDPAKPGNPSQSNPAGAALTEDELKAYADKVFELVNQERENAGVAPVVWDDEFAACAQIRAEELQYLYSHTRPVQPEDTTKAWPENTNGIGVYNAPSVADEQGVEHEWIMENLIVQRETPEAVMAAWMNSAGHKKNILKESHVRCGVGVYYTSEQTPTGFHWFWVVWFDSYEA